MSKALTNGFVIALATLLSAAAIAADRNAEIFDRASAHFGSGAFEQAVADWRELLSSDDLDSRLEVRARLGIAAACQQMGLYEQGLQALRGGQPALDKAADRALATRYQQQLGNLLIANQQPREGLAALNAAVAASESGPPAAHASVLNDLGNALAIRGYLSEAMDAHQRSLALARSSGQNALALASSVNLARLQMRANDPSSVRATLTAAAELVDPTRPSFEQAMALIALSDIERSLGRTPDGGPAYAVKRAGWLQQAELFATAQSNARLLSLVYGSQASDRFDQGDLASAEQLTRRALFFAAQERADDLAYRWHWQLGRVHREQRQSSAAAAELEAALHSLGPVRPELRNGYRDSTEFFSREVKPVYLDLVDALLKVADAAGEGPQQQETLSKALDTVERLKSAELQDYFRDECVVEQEAQATPVDRIAYDAAVLYPIVLADRLELLLRANGRLHRRTVRIDQASVADNALRLRELIQDRDSDRFLPYAQRLYRWLVAPVRAELDAASIRTIVVVPDGALRVIPFAVLHDGAHYLIADYAVVVTPSLTLTAPQPLRASRLQALLAGVSHAVQGFAPLPNVSAELATIQKQIDSKVLVDDDYTTSKVAAALTSGDYGIVHMATHSVVGETPADSFLLTYDGRLTMTDLERLLRAGQFRKQPVELLTLSACETAVGDERAALGLAGIAVRSGARSALATLWRVSDPSAASLMNRFYQQLNSRGSIPVTKASALQAAQRSLLADPATAHPAHWAAFVLIGNWL
jgi:CHAT domain-containing protein